MRQRETEREALFVAQNDRNGPHLSLSRRRMMLCRRVCAMSIASISQPSFHSSHRRMPPTAKMRCISSGSRRRRLSGRRQRMERTYEQGTTQHESANLLAATDWSAITKCLSAHFEIRLGIQFSGELGVHPNICCVGPPRQPRCLYSTGECEWPRFTAVSSATHSRALSLEP